MKRRAVAVARSRSASRLLAAALLVALLAGLLPAATAAAAASATPATGVTDALGRIVPVGNAGPVLATGPLGPQPGAPQANDVRFETVEVASDFGQESYKRGYATAARDPDGAQNATTNWDTALGHRIVFTVEVEGDQMTLSCDDRFVAVTYVQTTSGRLYGWTNGTFRTDAPGGPQDVCLDGLPGVRVYEVVFDLDGAPTALTGSIFPALLSGFYVASLELYHHVTPSPTNPSGQGPLAGVHDIGFMVSDPNLSLSETVLRFPERTLRMFSDVGASAGHADHYAMPVDPLRPSGNWTLGLEFPGVTEGTRFTRVDHFAVRVAPGVPVPGDPTAPLGDTPLDPLLERIEQQQGLGVQVERVEYTLRPDRVPASGRVDMTLRGNDFQSRQELLAEYVPLHVVTIFVPATLDTYTTGADSLVVPVSGNTFPLRELTVTDPDPILGATQVLLQDSTRETGGPLGANAGDLWALRPVGAAHDAITRALLQREADTQWVSGELPHRDFPGAVPRHRMLAMLHGPLDEYLGHRLLERGIDLSVEPARLVEGRSDEIVVTVRNLGADLQGGTAADLFRMTVLVAADGLPDGRDFAQNVTLDGGASRVLRVPVVPGSPGQYAVTFTATNGELERSSEGFFEVISRERAREEERKWYEIPASGLAPLVVGLIALAALARRRAR